MEEYIFIKYILLILAGIIGAILVAILISLALFVLVDFCGLYLYTSVFDCLQLFWCGCLGCLGYHYPASRAEYRRGIKLENKLKAEKRAWEKTLKIIIHSDVDIYTPNNTDLLAKSTNMSKEIANISCDSGDNHTTKKYNSQSLIKILKLKYDPQFSVAERKSFTDYFLVHVVLLFQNVLEEMKLNETEFKIKENESIGKRILEFDVFEASPQEIKFRIEIEALNSIWKDPEFQKYHSLEKFKGMSDSLDYLFASNNLQRITQPDYLPSNDDIEKLNIPFNDSSLAKNVPLLKTTINTNKNVNIQISQYSMNFRKLLYKSFKHNYNADKYYDIAIFIGRLENETFWMNYMKSPELMKSFPKYDPFGEEFEYFGNVIFLDERRLSEDKFYAFLNCLITNNEIPCSSGTTDKYHIISEIRKLAAIDTIRYPGSWLSCIHSHQRRGREKKANIKSEIGG